MLAQTKYWLILLLIAAINCPAQVSWKNVDSLFKPLPPSMHVYFTDDSLDHKPNRAFYAVITLKEKSVEFLTDTTLRRRITPREYFGRNGNPVLVVNGTFFSLTTSRNLNMVINDGKVLCNNLPSVVDSETGMYRFVTRSVLGISKKRIADVAWIFSDTTSKIPYQLPAPPIAIGKEKYTTRQALEKSLGCSGCAKPWSMETGIGGGPVLVANGEVHITNIEERMFVGRVNDRHPRTAMGYSADGRLFVLVIEGRNPGIAEGATLPQEASLLKELGCVEALNLDGGGSSCMLINGRQTIKPSDMTGQRPVPAVFMVRIKN